VQADRTVGAVPAENGGEADGDHSDDQAGCQCGAGDGGGAPFVAAGEVIDRGHLAYDLARRVWNGLVDRYPAVIARCAATADVVEAVRVAHEHRPVVSIRGGGHQVAGSAVCDDGLVIDLSAMKGVQVDANARTVRAQAGVTWGSWTARPSCSAWPPLAGRCRPPASPGLPLGAAWDC
jgi:hypothetical protein